MLEAGARGGASAQMRVRAAGRGWRYLGVDISADPNVDIVTDVHAMGPAVQDESVTVVYTSEVMEHLLSPPPFVAEAHRVLRDGGLFIARAPTTWPLHAEPWDFWRFSSHAWQGLLNETTGFEILEVCEFGEASIVPALPFWRGGSLMATYPAPLLTGVIARKLPGSVARGRKAIMAPGRYDPA
jgi:SAM-dependent methyltransferase